MKQSGGRPHTPPEGGQSPACERASCFEFCSVHVPFSFRVSVLWDDGLLSSCDLYVVRHSAVRFRSVCHVLSCVIPDRTRRPPPRCLAWLRLRRKRFSFPQKEEEEISSCHTSDLNVLRSGRTHVRPVCASCYFAIPHANAPVPPHAGVAALSHGIISQEPAVPRLRTGML